MAMTLVPAHARATVVAQYFFTSESLASSDSDPDSNASSFLPGSGFESSAEFFSPVGSNSLGVPSSSLSETESAAVSNDDYFYFTMTPVSGDELLFSELDFDFAATNNSSTITEYISLRWSLDNYASSLGIDSATIDSGGTEEGADFSLSGYPAVSTPVEFQLYVYDSVDNGSFSTLGITGIQLMATDVPEPSTPLLLLLAAPLLAAPRFAKRFF
jgi:hypothetical protein